MNLTELEIKALSIILENMGAYQFDELMAFMKTEDPKIDALAKEDEELAYQMFLTGFMKAGIIVFDLIKETSQLSQEDIMTMLTKKKEDLN